MSVFNSIPRFIKSAPWTGPCRAGSHIAEDAFISLQRTLHGFLRPMRRFLTDMINQGEHQTQNQPGIKKWPFGFIFGVQLYLRKTLALIKTKKKKILEVEQLWGT